jgi:hypothetical protein
MRLPLYSRASQGKCAPSEVSGTLKRISNGVGRFLDRHAILATAGMLAVLSAVIEGGVRAFR